jgi:LAS superfamily LD-carboxypeptidase LdcB
MRASGGVTLQPKALTAFRRAERAAGRSIHVVQSYRSCSQQASACERICSNPGGCPGRCAPPGASYHQLGLAIDIDEQMLATPGVVSALEEAGWCQSLPDSDPGHFSFGGCH